MVEELCQQASYILPIRKYALEDAAELGDYLRWLDRRVELIVVDASPPEIFEHHERAWRLTRHVKPDPALACENGKVWGVLTGLDLASHEYVVIADDDVRYDGSSLARTVGLLGKADVVRPQNYFIPLPWHAQLDTARSLINRATGGDWPGTLAVRRSLLLSSGGYDGDCLFENLELVRTVIAAGGLEIVARDVFVARRPARTSHFLSQRVRQAYDEFARPARLAAQLALLPTFASLLVVDARLLLVPLLLSVGLAEYGRRRNGGTRYFSARASLLAPVWLLERAICSWLAVGSQVLFGGIRYHGRVLRKAATPQSQLDARLAGLRVHTGDLAPTTEAEAL